MALSEIITSDDPDIVGRRKMAIAMRKRGEDNVKISERTGLTLEEIILIENTYYESQQELSEKAQRLKQMERLDSLLNMAYEQVELFGLADQKGNFGANLAAFVTVIREISELAGLKKQEIVHEIRVIEEKQADVVVLYGQSAVAAFANRIQPLLTAKGKKELTDHRQQWILDAVEGQAEILATTVEV